MFFGVFAGSSLGAGTIIFQNAISPPFQEEELSPERWQGMTSRVYHVVVAEPGRGLLDAAGRHPFLLDGDSHWVAQTGPNQLLQLLGLCGREQTCATLLGQESQDGVQTGDTESRFSLLSLCNVL